MNLKKLDTGKKNVTFRIKTFLNQSFFYSKKYLCNAGKTYLRNFVFLVISISTLV